MKRWLRWIVVAITLCILASIALWYSHQHIVLRLPSGFFPSTVYIQKNEPITFINLTLQPSWPAAGPHPTHTNYPDFDAHKGITPLYYWTFIFAQEGAFTFHDHYAPEITGIVISGSHDISHITDQSVCTALQDKQQEASCIEIYFRNITKTAEYQQARAIYEDIAIRYPDSCHSFSHDLGKNAYKAYLEGTLPNIGQEASSCAYGLWHGFTNAMQSDRGFDASKEFCASMNGASNELRTVNQMNCYHGIGIGLIPDPPSPNNWGKFGALVDPATAFCDTIQGDPLYKERCLTGVFHAMTTYMVNHLYGFAYDEHALSNCREQKPEYQYTCFITLVSALPKFTNRDVQRTVSILQESNPSKELFNDMFMNAAIMLVDTESSVEEMGSFVEKCDTINSDLRQICIKAVINNLFANGSPGKEYLKAFKFCSETGLNPIEQSSCFSESMSYVIRMYAQEKLIGVCDLIPSTYRQNMSQCPLS